MNPSVIRNIVRFVGVFLLQVLILKRVDLSIGEFNYLHIIIFPYVLFLLPFSTPRAVVLLIAFVYGILVDFFYHSPGVHAAALVFSGYMRTFVLGLFEPYEGYPQGSSPTLKQMGLAWFVSYMALLLLVYLFFYFSVDAFSFVYFFDILMSTLASFFPSIILILLLQFLFRSKH